MKAASTTDPVVGGAEASLEAARVEYEAWRDDAAMRSAIGDADYRAGLLARKQGVTDAEVDYREAIRHARLDILPVGRDIWSSLNTGERRELIRAAIVVRRATSTHTPLIDRVEIVWPGELEHDGTRRGIAATIRGRP